MLGSLCGDGDGRYMLGPLCAGGDSGPMLFGGAGDLWFLEEILCSACSNRSKCGGYVVVSLLHRLQGSRGRGIPILSQLGEP
jgi:hypothetical protein